MLLPRFASPNDVAQICFHTDPVWMIQLVVENQNTGGFKGLLVLSQVVYADQKKVDVLAHKEYIQWRNDQYRPKTWDDLARGLGQPLGYQGDKGINT